MARRIPLLTPILLCVVAATTLTACASSGGGTPSAAPTEATSAPPTAATTPASSPSPVEATSGTPMAVKACDVVTQKEASSLAGTSLPAGKEESTGGTGRRCTYGAGTTNVFWVQIAQASSAADAQAQWSTYQAQAEAALAKAIPGGGSVKPKLTTQSGLGDRAATATWSKAISGQTINLSAIYVIQGADFLAFGDLALNRKAPSTDDLTTQATASLGRLS